MVLQQVADLPLIQNLSITAMGGATPCSCNWADGQAGATAVALANQFCVVPIADGNGHVVADSVFVTCDGPTLPQCRTTPFVLVIRFSSMPTLWVEARLLAVEWQQWRVMGAHQFFDSHHLACAVLKFFHNRVKVKFSSPHQ